MSMVEKSPDMFGVELTVGFRRRIEQAAPGHRSARAAATAVRSDVWPAGGAGRWLWALARGLGGLASAAISRVSSASSGAGGSVSACPALRSCLSERVSCVSSSSGPRQRARSYQAEIPNVDDRSAKPGDRDQDAVALPSASEQPAR